MKTNIYYTPKTKTKTMTDGRGHKNCNFTKIYGKETNEEIESST